MKTSAKDKPDIAEMLDKMQQQLTVLENKINILISKSAPRPVETKNFPRPFQQTSHNLNRTERVLHKAICADCKKECEVPFRPTGDRPVYCKECFSKRKAGHPMQERPVQPVPFYKPQVAERKRHFEKKKPAARRQKAKKTKK